MYSSALSEFAASSLRLFLRVFATANEVLKEDHPLKFFLRVHIASIRKLLRALIRDTGTIARDELIIAVSRLYERTVKLHVSTTVLAVDETQEEAIVYV